MRLFLLVFSVCAIAANGDAQPLNTSIPILKSARLLLHTTDDDKDRDTTLHARLVKHGALFAYGKSAGESYAENTIHELSLDVSTTQTTKRDAIDLKLSMNIVLPQIGDSVANDHWKFIPALRLTFSDGSVITREWKEVSLGTDNLDLVLDLDGLRQMAERYSPQLMHPANEPNLPANVEWFLPHTTMNFINRDCPADNRSFGTATMPMFQFGGIIKSACGGSVYTASGTRSAHKRISFYLSDVDPTTRRGSLNASDWSTYYHGYPNDTGGWTIQYWTFYPFNTGRTVHVAPLPPVEIGYHGGDWEMVAVVLDGQEAPVKITTTGHTDMVTTVWSNVTKVGTHPIVYTEFGAHEVHTEMVASPSYIEHRTWPGSVVHGMPGGDQAPGPLVDLGTRLRPLVPWLEYSGLWGSPGVLESSSGYWGPAFNETGMRADGFLTAWCSGTADPAEQDSFQKECFPRDPR